MSDTSRFLCYSACQAAYGGSSEACIALRRLQEALQKYYRFTEFRQGQLDALLPVVHGKDTFVRMATGAGKTLCIFLAPLAYDGDSSTAVIISPLNGLMDQQACGIDIPYSGKNWRGF